MPPKKTIVRKRTTAAKKKKSGALEKCPPLYPVGSPLQGPDGRYWVVTVLEDRTEKGEKFELANISVELQSLSPEPANDPAVMMWPPHMRNNIFSSRSPSFCDLIRDYEPVESLPDAENRRWEKLPCRAGVRALIAANPDPDKYVAGLLAEEGSAS